jgi:hypothetical protein
MSARLQTTIAAAAASLALGLLAPGMASAAACHPEAGAKHYFVCVNGTRLGSLSEVASESFKASLAAGTKLDIKHKFLPEEGHITCETASLNGELTSGGSSAVTVNTGSWSAKKCKAIGTEFFVKHCEVYNERVNLGELTASDAASTELSLGPKEAGGYFDKFQIERYRLQTCYAQSTHEYASTGELPCKLPQGASETVAKTLECAGPLKAEEHEGEHLEFAVTIELSGVNKGKAFSVYEGT